MVSVLIPIYNDLPLIREHFADYIELFESYGIHDIIVINDDSEDDGVRYIRDFYPEIRVLNNPVRRSLGVSVNIGMTYVQYPITWVVSLEERIVHCDLNKALRFFDRSDIFSVLPSAHSMADHHLINGADFLNSQLSCYWLKDRQFMDGHFALTQGITSLLVSTEKFRFLGGCDELFEPVDAPHIDLTLSALRWGWPSVITQDIQFKEADQDIQYGANDQYILMTEYLLLWKHMDDLKDWLLHLGHVFSRLCLFKVRHTRAILKCIFRIPSVIQSRASIGKVWRLSDVSEFLQKRNDLF